MRAPATPERSIAMPRSTTTSGFSPMRRAQRAPTAVAKRNPETRRTKYEGKSMRSARKSSGRICSGLGLRRRRNGIGQPIRNPRQARRSLRREHVERHESHSDANGDVGDVEGRPVMVATLENDVNVDEVDDVPVADA